MIGDNYEADNLGAKNIGMEVIFFNTNNQNSDENIKQIDNLLALKHYL